MTSSLGPAPSTAIVYRARSGSGPPRELVLISGPDAGLRFAFHGTLEIGRLEPGTEPEPGTLGVGDLTVSSRHCVVTLDPDGRCFVRDLSLNGTRIDHRRLVPGAETELHVGQVIAVTPDLQFRLEGAPIERAAAPGRPTIPTSAPLDVTVVVGDIADYTALVRELPPGTLQPVVSALFEALERRVAEVGGTVKEYPGDAILAYWEADGDENSALRACRAVLALEREFRATGDGRWSVADRPLRLQWSLATGPVMIQRLGGPHALGLSMVGEPVIKAFRLEKLADAGTGPIVACGRTCALAGESFHFRSLGSKQLYGFGAEEECFSLAEAP